LHEIQTFAPTFSPGHAFFFNSLIWDEAMDAPDSDPDDPAHAFLFELDDGRVIDARIRGNAARWINHSCAPNCVASEDEDGHVFIEAKRRIHPGEELTYDYRLSVDAPLTKKERAQYIAAVAPPSVEDHCSIASGRGFPDSR
jgi:hypothetical protein